MDCITLKNARLKYGMSLAEMGEVLGLSKKHVWDMEEGKKAISDSVTDRVDIFFRKNQSPENSVKWHRYPAFKPRTKNGFRLLVSLKNGVTDTRNYNFFSDNDGWDDVVAWAELPAPYTEEAK